MQREQSEPKFKSFSQQMSVVEKLKYNKKAENLIHIF